MQSNSTDKSYGQILKSSSIIGGSAAINIVIGMISAKAGAVFLGPEGIGLLKLYGSATGMLRTLSSLGINSSGVREIAEAIGSEDQGRVGRMVLVLRKMCWGTGILGFLLALLTAYPLSYFLFGDASQATSLMVLGSTLLFSAISGSQLALMQGMRRISDLAIVNVVSAIVGVVISVGFYWLFGLYGIVPALCLSALGVMLVSWLYSRRLPIPVAPNPTWRESVKESRRLVSVGLAFMWSGVASGLVGLCINAMISRMEGIEANGYYGAAWSLSGLLANFVLGAMGADFCPRLTQVQHDHPTMCRLVNEQTEVAILLGLPGLVATLLFARPVIEIFYSSNFLIAADLLPWFALGVFGRVTSWPMGFVLIAKGEARWFAATETISNLLHIGLVWIGLLLWGLIATSVAFFILYIFVNLIILILIRHLIGYSWSRTVLKLLLMAGGFLLAALGVSLYLRGGIVYGVGLLMLAACGIVCLCLLVRRVGFENRIVQFACRFPGMEQILKSRKLPEV